MSKSLTGSAVLALLLITTYANPPTSAQTTASTTTAPTQSEIVPTVFRFFELLRESDYAEARKLVFDKPGSTTTERLVKIAGDLRAQQQTVAVVDIRQDDPWAWVVLKSTTADGKETYEGGPMIRLSGRWYMLMRDPVRADGSALDESEKQRFTALAKWAAQRQRQLAAPTTAPATTNAATIPPAQALQNVFSLLKTGDVDGAIKLATQSPDQSIKTEFTQLSEALRTSQLEIKVLDSNQDGNIAVVICQMTHQGVGSSLEAIPMLLAGDAQWYLCPPSASDPRAMDAQTAQRFGKLQRWAIQRQQQLSPAIPSSRPATQPAR
jgi:hypothetical protein